MHGRTWGWRSRGHTPVIEVAAGNRQSVSAASAVNAKGAFLFVTYKGGMTAELFVSVLKHIMRGRRKPLFIVLDSLPAHKARVVQDYVVSTNGSQAGAALPARLCPAELNPDELRCGAMSSAPAPRKTRWSRANRCKTALRQIYRPSRTIRRLSELSFERRV